MSKTHTLRAIDHSSKVVTLVNTFIRMKVIQVDSPARFRIMADVVPRDLGKRNSLLQNLYIYARVGLDLPEDRILEIFDIETDQKICEVAQSKVLMDSSYIFE